MEIEQETPEEKTFFESGGEAAPEADKTDATTEVEKTEKTEKTETSEKTETQVPYNALHEERMLRKEATQELKSVKEQVEQLQSLKDELQKFRTQKQSETDEASYEDDPLGHLRKQQEELQTQMNDQEQQNQSRQAQLQEVQQLQSTINAQVNDFIKDHGDYQDALTYVTDRRTTDLISLGITDPEQQQQILNTEAWNIAQTALHNNKNPAEVVYAMANSWGYKAAGAEKTELQEKVETINKGQAESQTLSDAGGAPDSTGISLTDIESMSDSEFDKLWDKMENG